MRNLKKFLALVLAMMMAFSLMVTVNAKDITADFTDAESVTEDFQEGVDVLSGMKVFEGYEDGSFKPKNNITRAEVATIVYRLATGDWEGTQAHLYKDYQKFDDVKPDHWAAGYINYCANAEWIAGYGNGKFGPNDSVTGYQAAAMILRAVGYGKNGEFQGPTWQVQVANVTRSKDLLTNVDKTTYANTLNNAAPRELVAEILFQAAQIPTVTWTQLNGYNEYPVALPTTGTAKNPSLGKTNYGLTKVTGVIVGNQDTGESKTFIATGTGENKYFYANTSAKCDAKTGLDMFGHNVTVWYNANNAAGTTYALYDNVVKTALVTPLAANGTMVADATNSRLSDSAAGEAPLGRAAQKAGFDVDLKTSKAVFNNSFNQSGTKTTKDAGGNVTNIQNDYNVSAVSTYVAGTSDAMLNAAPSATALGNTGAANSYPLYLLISNNSSLTVDMVVALNVSVSRITQVNAHASVPTITVEQVTGANDKAGGGTPLPAAWNDKYNGMIDQKALTATSDKALDTPVVGVAIVGTKPYKPTSASLTAIGKTDGTGTSALAYRLSKPTQTVEGTVTNFNYNSGAHDGSIVIGGKRIERSLLADAISQYDPASATNRGMTDPVNLSATANLYGNYRAYLDSEGKYIWIEPIYNTEFVYGTYIDYTTPYGSSTYEYTLVGVNLKGEQVKRVVKTLDGEPIDNITDEANSVPMKNLGLPYRDSTNVAGVTKQSYVGFLIDSEGNLTSAAGYSRDTTRGTFSTISPSVGMVGSGTTATAAGANILANNATWSFNTTDAKLGTKLLGLNTYATSDTKFILVNGGGTDTQKIEVYNGIEELLKGGSTVTISGANGLAATDDAYLTDHADVTNDGRHFNEQMYYTQSALSYASVDGTNPMKIDTIILPKDAVSWTGGSGLYYVGNPAQDSEIKQGVNTFHLYTMYENGEEVQKWLINDPAKNQSPADDGKPDHALVKDSFYVLVDTGLKTPMGDPVYRAHDDGTADTTGGKTAGTIGTSAVWSSDAGITQLYSGKGRPGIIGNNCHPILNKVEYNAATYASQTAKIGVDVNGTADADAGYAIFNVSGAKVVNLNAKNTGAEKIWPNITDLGTLNEASSTSEIYNGTGNFPNVSIQTSPTDPLTVTVIYVNWDQTP